MEKEKIDYLKTCCVNPAGTFTYFDGGSQKMRLISQNGKLDWSIYYDNALQQTEREFYNEFVWVEGENKTVLTTEEKDMVAELVEMEINALKNFLKTIKK